MKDIDLTVLADLCGDVDGCTVTVAMTNYNSLQSFPPALASNGPFAFFYDPVNNTHRIAEGATGGSGTKLDGGGSGVNHVLTIEDCFFTDGEFVPGQASGTDNVVGFQLLNNGAFHVDNGCVLVIKD